VTGIRIPNKPTCVFLLLTRPSDELVSYWLGMTAMREWQLQLSDVAVDELTRQWKRRYAPGMIDIKFNDKEEVMQPLNHHEPQTTLQK